MVGKDKKLEVSRREGDDDEDTAGGVYACPCATTLMIGMRRTLMLLFSTAAALLLARGAVLALPSEKPDNTPMVDGRVRAIEQVGTNVWLGGRISHARRGRA
jgi:hypothetical protein